MRNIWGFVFSTMIMIVVAGAIGYAVQWLFGYPPWEYVAGIVILIYLISRIISRILPRGSRPGITMLRALLIAGLIYSLLEMTDYGNLSRIPRLLALAGDHINYGLRHDNELFQKLYHLFVDGSFRIDVFEEMPSAPPNDLGLFWLKIVAVFLGLLLWSKNWASRAASQPQTQPTATAVVQHS